jgi:3-deoxy-manno-octulosonate cytidylyltransferase (CMP-KDO synthetase)
MRTLSRPDRTTNLTVGLIPARWSSSRFEGKPLALINGIPMIRRVYDLACQVKQLDTVVVLTDDDRIVDYCSKNEMRCIVVEDDVRSGTDRCAKALELLDGDIFVNIQGDEPLLNPDAVDRLISEHRNGVSNAYVYVNNDDKLQDKNVVKTITDMNSNAIYYSRLPIPYQQKESTPFKQQLGLYCFDRHMLKIFPSLLVGDNEKAESVEMLRYIENGYAVNMVEVEDEGLSVDTIEDLKKVEEFLNNVH